MTDPTERRRATEGQWKVKCSATANSTGLPCQAWAVRGATVCGKHGAAIGTAARAKADQRMETAADRARQRIADAADQAAQHLVGALSSADEKVALKAALEVLDRNGLSAVARTEVHLQGDPLALDRQIEQALAQLAASR